MAQFKVETGALDAAISKRYEVVMLANNANGDIVSLSNPLPVTLGSSNITITGDVNVGTTVNVSSTPEAPVHVHLTEVGIGGLLNVAYLPVGGNINVINTVVVTGNVTANGTINVGNFPATQTVNGTINIGNTVQVNVSNFPLTQNVTIMKNGLAVSDTVALPTRVLNDEGLIAYARGAAVTEAEVLNAYLIDKSGATSNIGITPATMTTVWDGTGLYPWNTFTGSGDKLYVKSVTDDAKVRGSTIEIEGLDSNYNLIFETITLNGSNSAIDIVTSNNFYRIIRTTLTGNNNNSIPNDYDIDVRYGSGSGTLIDKITACYGRTQSCTYTVPVGFEAFLLAVNGSSGKDDEITSMVWARPYTQSWFQAKTFKFISGTYEHNFRTPIKFTEKTDIEMRAYALVESSRVGVEMQLLVLPKV